MRFRYILLPLPGLIGMETPFRGLNAPGLMSVSRLRRSEVATRSFKPLQWPCQALSRTQVSRPGRDRTAQKKPGRFYPARRF